MQNKYSDQELEVLAAIGEFLVTKLAKKNDVARAVFDELTPQFLDKW